MSAECRVMSVDDMGAQASRLRKPANEQNAVIANKHNNERKVKNTRHGME